jgi:hypothetical protein
MVEAFPCSQMGLKDNDFDCESSDADEQRKSFSLIATLVDSIWTIRDRSPANILDNFA